MKKPEISIPIGKDIEVEENGQIPIIVRGKGLKPGNVKERLQVQLEQYVKVGLLGRGPGAFHNVKAGAFKKSVTMMSGQQYLVSVRPEKPGIYRVHAWWIT